MKNHLLTITAISMLSLLAVSCKKTQEQPA